MVLHFVVTVGTGAATAVYQGCHAPQAGAHPVRHGFLGVTVAFGQLRERIVLSNETKMVLLRLGVLAIAIALRRAAPG